jgi:hypothetical protein
VTKPHHNTMKRIAIKPLFDFLIMMTIFTILLWLAINGLGLTSHSVFYAWATVALNTILGYILCEYAHALRSTKFLQILLIGQGIRWVIVAAIVVLLMLTQSVNITQFAWATLIFYACYLPIEMFAILNKMRFEKKLEKLLQL